MSELQIVIPSNAENLQLPDPDLLTLYQETDRRMLWIDFEINEALLGISKKIIQWNYEDKSIPIEDRRPIYIAIFSPGGDIYSTLNCIDIMLSSKTPIVTINMGLAMSCGFWLLLAGKTRYALSHSTALAHQGDGIVGGTFSQTKEATKNYERQIEELESYTISKTKIPTDLFEMQREKDWYFSAEEQVKYGVVDAIIDDITILFEGCD